MHMHKPLPSPTTLVQDDQGQQQNPTVGVPRKALLLSAELSQVAGC